MLLLVIGSAFILDLSFWISAIVTTFVALSFLLGIVSYRIWGSATRAIREGLLGFVFWPVFGIGIGKGYIGRIRNMSSI